jgi:hypothetical protein
MMRPENNFSHHIKDFIEDYGIMITLLGILASMVLCVLQLILRVTNQLPLILALLLFGLVILGWGVWDTITSRFWSFASFSAMLIGAVILVFVYLLAFQPNSQVSLKFRSLYRPDMRTIKSQDLKISLDIAPTQYQPGERGTISMNFENHSEYTLVFETIMLETQKPFFEGFVVDYESAYPPISQRKNKMGVSTALFFGEEPIVIPPGGSYTAWVEIVANVSGDYSDEFFVTVFMDLQRTEAAPGAFVDHSEKFLLVILPEKSALDRLPQVKLAMQAIEFNLAIDVAMLY